MSMLGTRVMREQRILLSVARDPLVFHRKQPTPLEEHTLRNLRNRGLVEFWSPRSHFKTEWFLNGSEPWRVTVTEKGIAALPDRKQTLLRLGAEWEKLGA